MSSIEKFRIIKFISPSMYRSIHHNLGLRSYLDILRLSWENFWFDIRYGVKTSRIVPANRLAFDKSQTQTHAVRHRPSPVLCVKRSLIKLLELAPSIEEQALVDYGSGLGRVIIIAAELGFKEVIGLELSPKLNRICHQNMTKYRRRNPNALIRIMEQDAASYLPPRNSSIFFFFRPFDSTIHQMVMEQILSSYNENPRQIFCLTLQANYDFSKYGFKVMTKEYGVTIYHKAD